MTDTSTQATTIDIVFDGPPAHESGRFVEVEDKDGKSISVGEWIQRSDGYWVLRIPDPRALVAERDAAVTLLQNMPAEIEALQANRPSDPLANSHDGALRRAARFIRDAARAAQEKKI